MFMCEVCKVKKPTHIVDILDADVSFKYKVTYRCDECKNQAVRSHEKLKVEKI